MASDEKIKERPTLKTIARMSGLAVPTVSRALNDAPDIGQGTKAKVREIAKQIGYHPNRAGQRLRTGKTNVITLIISTEHDLMNRTARLITSIASGTRGTPYHLIITPYFPDQDPMEPVRYVTETRSADGIILNQTTPDDPRVAYLMETGFPFATHGRTKWCDDHPYYDFDNRIFARKSVARLAEAGRKHILLVAPRPDQTYAIEMIGGTKSEAEKLGLKTTILTGATADSEATEIEGAVHRHLSADPFVDGVISASSHGAMAAVGAIEAKGLTIGREIDLVAKDSLPFLKRFRKDIIIMHEDVKQVGSFLCKALLQAIDRPELAPMQYLELPEDHY